MIVTCHPQTPAQRLAVAESTDSGSGSPLPCPSVGAVRGWQLCGEPLCWPAGRPRQPGGGHQVLGRVQCAVGSGQWAVYIILSPGTPTVMTQRITDVLV